MPDTTARILAQHGTPTSQTEYAIHQASHAYRQATNGTTDLETFRAAAAVRRNSYRAALAWHDQAKSAGDTDTPPICHARDMLATPATSAFADGWRETVIGE